MLPSSESLQRPGIHIVLGRGRGRPALVGSPRARVLTARHAAAELNRQATHLRFARSQ